MFWRETGMNDDDDEVEARDGACSIETAMAGITMSTGQGRAACGRSMAPWHKPDG